jgi:hypothetical protein
LAPGFAAVGFGGAAGAFAAGVVFSAGIFSGAAAGFVSSDTMILLKLSEQFQILS